MTEEKTTVWTRLRGKGTNEPVLVGRKISADWLKVTTPILELSFTGELFQSLSDLLAIAKTGRKNLPIVSLRTRLIAGVDGIITLDRELGLNALPNGSRPPAITLYALVHDDRDALRECVANHLRCWLKDDLDQWAERHELGALIARIKAAIQPENVALSDTTAKFVDPSSGRPDFTLIARTIGDRLIGEKLFDGLGNPEDSLGCCELVASPESRSNSVELMTLPIRSASGDDVFSMVARITVCSMPYTKDLFLGVSAVKRVWAKRKPVANGKQPQRVTGYVMSPGRPAMMVSVERRDGAWEFGDGYAAAQVESGFKVPETLEKAIERRDFDPNTGWWAGLPQLPTLFKSVSPRTVFEGDEVALLNTISALLPDVLQQRPIGIREIPLGRTQKKQLQEMLRLSDLEFGTAGDSLVSEAADETHEEELDDEETTGSATRQFSIQKYREQNVRALELQHGAKKPVIWVLCNLPAEQEIIRTSVATLFGEAVSVIVEPLPAGTHGLRAELEGDSLVARARFDLRVKKWESATATIKEKSGGCPIIALICAADKYNNRMEDPVNFYAGIHAMSKIGANVHHVLPIENPEDPDSRQGFLHRSQSALLDVLLAHSGIVFGVKDFMGKVLPEGTLPRAVYGIQAIRSRARARSGESGVTFILYSRLVVETGVTEVQFVYRGAGGNKSTEWMPLSVGLQWLGSQRALSEGDDRWLKESFVGSAKEMLARANEEDPRAIVMIDWASVGGLWRGIRDEDLSPDATPALDRLPLSYFSGMSFVRVRRGMDTLSMRTAVKASYEGWSLIEGRARTGEVQIDSYFSTGKNLVEVTDEMLAVDKPFGHFIATMGYAKTVQVKRGFSCYRPMPRMAKISADVKEYRQKMLEPASLDAALPAAMDITVLTAPAGVPTRAIAMVVMGLRLGYAHFNDWTSLPAPMFFRRKIEDYVIRFPDDTEDAGSPQVDEAVTGQDREDGAGIDDASAESVKTLLAQAVGSSDAVPVPALGPTSEACEEAPSEEAVSDEEQEELAKLSGMTSVELGFVLLDLLKDETLAAADLLSQVKELEMSSLFGSRDPKQRAMACRILCEDPKVRVRVDLPSWVRPHGIFGNVTATVRRNARKVWKLLRQFGYVPSVGKPMPPVGEFMNWLGDRLQTPQATYAMQPACADIGGLKFVQLVEIVETEYNPTRPAEERVDMSRISAAGLRAMSEWANQTRHDAMQGWLLFMAAQFPSPGWHEAVLEPMTEVAGPLALEALRYYGKVSVAVDLAIDQKDHLSTFTPVIVRNPKPAPALAADAKSLPPQKPMAAAVSDLLIPPPPEAPLPYVATVAPAAACVELSKGPSPVMAIKNKLVDLIRRLEPGSETFVDLVQEIQVSIEAISAIHRTELDKSNVLAALAARLDALKARCDDLIVHLTALKGELELGDVAYVAPGENSIDLAEEGVSAIEVVIGDILALRQKIISIEDSPPSSSLSERQKRVRVLNDAMEEMMASNEELRELLERCVCLVVASPVTPTTPPELPSDDSSAPEIEAEAAAHSASAVDSQCQASAMASEPNVESVESVIEPEQIVAQDPPVASVEAAQEAPVPAVGHVATPPMTPVDGEASPSTSKVVEELSPKGDEDDDDEADEKLSADISVEGEIVVLQNLFKRRCNGLAEAHIAALRAPLAELAGAGPNFHYVLLRSLAASLEKMDCQSEFDPRVDGELRDLISNHTISTDVLCEAPMTALGALAACLSGMLFDSGEAQWGISNAIGQRLLGYPALSRLISHISDFQAKSLQLTRDMFEVSHIGEAAAAAQEVERFQKRADGWGKSPEIFSAWNHRGFMALHKEIFSVQHPIGLCLSYVAKGDVAKTKSAFAEARRKFEKPGQTVDETYKKIGERTKPDGTYRQRAIENIEITRQFIESYLSHIERQKAPNTELVKSTQSYLLLLHRYLADAVAEVVTMPDDGALSQLYRDSAATALRCALRLFDKTRSSVCVATDKQRLLMQVPMTRSLMPDLDPVDAATPALCDPRDVFAETARWSREDLFADLDDGALDAALIDARRRHVDSQRFLPAFKIESMLPRQMQISGEPLKQTYNRHKADFSAKLQEARQKVTHAMTLNALPQSEANMMQRVIEEMLSSLRQEFSIGHPDSDSSPYADIPQAMAVLRYNVLIPLEARLSEAKQRLLGELQAHAEKFGIEVAHDVQRIRAMAESANAASLRTAYDALAMLKQPGAQLPRSMEGPVNVTAEFEGFMDKVHNWVPSHKNRLEGFHECLSQPASESDPDWLKALTQEERDGAVELIGAWISLFAAPRRNLVDDSKPLEKVFNLLGINHSPSTMPEHGRMTRMRFMLPERAFSFPPSADDDTFIPPALGSWATHIQGFMLYGAPDANDMRQLIQEVGATPTVTLARARLKMKDRVKITGHFPVLLIDDDLVAYVALHPHERLQALMRVAVLTFFTNPYDDYGGRPVPSEMFFGRKEELRRLREVKSFGVLFGGRRLGKSSLLSQIERETSQQLGSRAVYVSMETVNSSSNHVTAAWDFICRSLVSRRIIQPLPSQTNKWQTIRDWIAKELTDHKDLKSLYLLIDEADSLMACELKVGKDETSFVRSLQQMVDNLHTCTVRFVIAGLHNMARMTTEENSVFGKADTIALEPFNTPDDIQRGIRLITKPLAAMGYLFGPGGEDLPLRILSVCNFYPAFIQLYCRKLVERLQNNRQEKQLPIMISADDLDVVESDNSLLTELRRKFELNLNLDKRYKAIALILADVYYSEIEKGRYIGLTTSEIADCCEDFVANHFKHTGAGVYEALLDEMKKLNVIERLGTRYVLRNPNIAMMMGDRDRVSTQIEELAKEPSEESRNHGERRIYMDCGSTHLPFPFPVAWVRRYLSDTSDGELLVITGNELSGVADLIRPAGKEQWSVGQEGVFTMLPGSGPMAANDYVTKNRRPAADSRSQRFVAVRPISWAVSQIPEFVAAAGKAAKHGIRFLLLGTPERALELSHAIDSGSATMEEGKWRVVHVPEWTNDALFFHLHENVEVSENSAALSALRTATCGYTREVLGLCNNRLSVAAAMKLPDERREALAPNRSEFYRKIGMPPAIPASRLDAAEQFLAAVSGMKRQSEDVNEWREMLAITDGEMLFLQWMGLLQEGDAGTWHVPALYGDLLKDGAS